MFNRSGFNNLGYNLPDTEVTLSAELSAATSLSARTTARMISGARLSAQGSITSRTITTQSFRAGLFARSSARAKVMRIASYRAKLSTQGNLYANVRRYQVLSLRFTGSLAPGQMIIIHTRHMLILRDGQDATDLMQGQFGRLRQGVNEFVYRDTSVQRNVLLQVEHKDISL